MSSAQFQSTFCIPDDHPSLPGHFPDRPVVPGVILLDHIARALQAWRGAHIAGLPQVKFIAPLLPQQEAQLSLEASAKNIRFSIHRGAVLIASGSVDIGAEYEPEKGVSA